MATEVYMRAGASSPLNGAKNSHNFPQTDSVRLKRIHTDPYMGSALLARSPNVVEHLKHVILGAPSLSCSYVISSLPSSAHASRSSLAHLLMLEISAYPSCCNSPPPRAMLVLSINLIIQRCIDLGSIKFSLSKT